MECPKCGSTNVTSTGLGTGVWECMNRQCGTKFPRDQVYALSNSRKVNGIKAG